MIESVVYNLEGKFGGKVISNLPLRPLPNDIDVYIPEIHKNSVIEYLNTEGFVCLEDENKCGARKYIQGECYFLDVIFNPNYLNKLFPKTHFTQNFFDLVQKDGNVDRFFKYTLSLRSDKQSMEFISQNFDKYQNLFFDKNYVLNIPFRQNITKKSLIGMVKGNIVDTLRVVTLSQLTISLLHRTLYKLKSFGSGEIIAVVGPDGSGKSTVIDALVKGLFASKMYMGDWGFLLQPIYNKMHSKHISIARLTYPFFYIENWFRYIKAYILKFSGHTVLIDRWPGLNRHLRRNNIWLHLNDIMYTFFPKADRYIFISAPPEVIHARKQELDPPEILESQKNMRARLKKRKSIEIENLNLDDCLNQALRYILKDR